MELILSLLFLGSVMAGYAFILPWAVRTRRQPPCPPVRSVAADEPSGPVVSGAELIEATWLRSRRFPDPDPYPYFWRDRYRGGHRVTEEVAS